MAGQTIACRHCGNKLGEWVEEGLVRQRHRGRMSLGLPLMISCEGCGKNWTAPAALVEKLLDLLGGPDVPETVIPVPPHPRTPAPTAAAA